MRTSSGLPIISPVRKLATRSERNSGCRNTGPVMLGSV